jgi:BMFP domain-containing protein YqiC
MNKPSDSVPAQVPQFAPKPKPRKDGLTDDLRGLLQRVAGKSKRTSEFPVKVADQNSNKTPDPAPKQLAEVDPIDNAGHAVITVLNKAASISNEEYERATALAADIANKLRTTERRIQELEAEAARFRDRAARAEEWMQRISHEIESKFIAPEGAPPKTPSGSSNQDR